ncbi:sensor domain-containing protein [Zhongshania aquimaris]|uniref:EAL domain-containing protein n=1 Tax=Zhongshania aquimaris TaxID=2857107 RepID=A0ABS6VS89_9GAMM|nr:EAL domain-containing protein [Zhongshania aquimaris]MBW2941190.1 EAL domain-containing protein [Zhongshania aquimaris]
MRRHPAYNPRPNVLNRQTEAHSGSGENYDRYPTPYLIIDEKYWILYANSAALREIDTNLLDGIQDIKRNNLLRYIKRGTTEFLDWIDADLHEPLELLVRCNNQARRCLLYKSIVEENASQQIHITLLIVDSQNFADAEFNTHRLVFTNTNQAIYVSNSAGKITAVNPAFCHMFKYTEQQIIGCDEAILFDDATKMVRSDEIKANLEHSGSWMGRISIVDSKGNIFPSSLHASTATKENSSDYLIVGIIKDISQQLLMEKQLKDHAEIDSLTQLQNRLAFNRYFADTFKEAQRNDEQLNLLFIDLDKFKELNDQFGHDYGDELLINVSLRLQNTLKKTDFIARLGGDEFVVLFRGELQKETLITLGSKLINVLAEPFTLKDIRYQCTSSIGIARYPHDAITAEKLVQAADSAMYLAKKSGRNCCSLYNEDAQQRAHAVVEQRAEFKDALANGQIKTYFQPIHNLLTGKVIAYEALARWVRSDDDIRMPTEFLPIIENDVLMIKLGLQVITQVYQLSGIFSRMSLATGVSINLSAIQIRSEELISYIETLFAKQGYDYCHNIHVEIAEPLVFEKDPVILDNLNRLTDLGFQLTLDNFGRGNSSIYALKRIKFSTVKIDRVFLESMGSEDSQDAQILTGLIQLLHNLDVKIICEGVESQEYVHFLLDRGCVLAQGWLFSEAMAKGKILQYQRQLT